jgi:hypothetical protein
MAYRVPTESETLAIIGMNGSGKTQGGAFVLSRMRFQEYPFILMNFKREEMFAEFNPFPMTSFTNIPRTPGIYNLNCTPYDVEEGKTDEFFLAVHQQGNCGIFIDECMEIGNSKALRLCLTQGRSLKIPMIICTQRPKLVPVAVFTEAKQYMIYDQTHPDDRKLIAGYVRQEKPLPDLNRYWFWWYDKVDKQLLKMRPVPDRNNIIQYVATEQRALAANNRSRTYI